MNTVQTAGKKFISSYSGGKDGALAIHKAIERGMIPVALITTFNREQDCSWFHAIPEAVLESIAESVGVPLWLIKTNGDEYEKNFEKTLRFAKEQGAKICVFGDIDIEEHIKWCTERCENAGIEPMFPLYGCSRESVVNNFIDSGYTAHFTIIDTDRISGDLIGKPFTKEAIDLIKSQGADICGEKGEYHTFVSAGAIFKKPIEFVFGEKVFIDNKVVLPIECISPC